MHVGLVVADEVMDAPAEAEREVVPGGRGTGGEHAPGGGMVPPGQRNTSPIDAKQMMASVCRGHCAPSSSIEMASGGGMLRRTYRADWEQAATSGRRALGVFWRYPAVLWGPSTPNPTQGSWKTLILKKWPIFPASCGYVVVLPHVAQVRFWRPKKPHSE